MEAHPAVPPDPAARTGSLAGAIAAVFAGAMLMVLGARLPDLALDHDEVEHLHAAWRVSEGDLPYRDFGENHNPVLWAVLAPILHATDSPRVAVWAGRAAMAGCSLLTLVLAGLLAWRLSGPRAAWLAPVILSASSYWTVYAVQVRPDVPMTTLALLGLLLGLPRDGKPSAGRALAAGVALGLAAALLLKAVVVVAILFAGCLVLAATDASGRRHRERAAAALAAGTLLVLASMAGLLHAAGILDGFWLWVVRFQGPYLLGGGATGFAFADVLVASFARDSLAWAGLLLALVAFAARPKADVAILLAMVAAIVGGTALTRLPNYQYLFPAIALMAVLGAGAAVETARRLAAHPRLRRAAAGALVLAIAVLGGRHALAIASLPDDEVEVGRMERVLAMTAPGDTVLASPPNHPIFRRDALYLWFNNPDFHNALDSLDPPPPYDRYKGDPDRLRDRPPAVIVKAGARWHSFYRVGSLANERFAPTGDPEVLVRAR